MSVLESVVLAIIEGLTEFLPVSSTGHIIVASSVMGIAADPFAKTFTVAIQLGAILSVIVVYWKRFLPRRGAAPASLHFYLKLFTAFLPAAILGFMLNDYIDRLLERVEVVAVLLILGGVVFLFIDRFFQSNEASGTIEVSYPSAFKIGLFQSLAMAPGVSRSAASIIGGMIQNLTKKAAAEFSFFLAVPTMFAATLYKLFKFYKSGSEFGAHEIMLLAIGNGVAFVVAILAIRTFIRFLTLHGFKVFGYYRIGLGIVILLLYYFGANLSVV